MTEDVKIRALIVDDEPDARLKIRNLLARHEDVEIVGDCVNGYEAIAAIKEQAPDLVFLDMEMPEIDGFAVLKRIEKDMRPLVIFVTVHKECALQAYDVDPVHFLLKPLDRKRFDEALHRAKLRLSARSESEPAPAKIFSGYRKRLLIKTSEGRNFILQADKIEWIEAEGKYVRLHFEGKSPLLREPISNLEAQLDPDKFLLIHRSYIVNIDCIRELQPLFNQKYIVVLRDNTELPLSESGRKKLARLGISL